MHSIGVKLFCFWSCSYREAAVLSTSVRLSPFIYKKYTVSPSIYLPSLLSSLLLLLLLEPSSLLHKFITTINIIIIIINIVISLIVIIIITVLLSSLPSFSPTSLSILFEIRSGIFIMASDMPDLSHLTQEERQIIESVMLRQKQEEEREHEIMR